VLIEIIVYNRPSLPDPLGCRSLAQRRAQPRRKLGKCCRSVTTLEKKSSTNERFPSPQLNGLGLGGLVRNLLGSLGLTNLLNAFGLKNSLLGGN
jgi:hypothetical protein